jgi:NAD(P)-dependent dehydrogenase (short-subunit alcohol dehydrogenase family)
VADARRPPPSHHPLGGSIGGRATTYVCDLTDFDAVDALVARVLEEHGGVDYPVNNAGRSIRRSLELSYDRFHDVQRTMALNHFGPVRRLGEWVAILAPRFSDSVMYRYDKQRPDSAAARGEPVG